MTLHTRILVWYALIGIPLAFGLAVWGLSGLTAHYILAADSIAETGKETRESLPYMLTSVKMLAEDLGALKSTIVHADLVARHEQQNLGKYDQLISSTASDIHSTLESANGTFNATARVADQATADLRTLNTTITQVNPLLVHADDTISDLDGVLKDAAIKQTLANLDTTSANFATVSGNFARVTTFYADDITKPKTLKQKIESRLGLGLDAAGFAFRHF